MPVNPFDYSKKTFLQMYNELKILWPSKPDWFMVLIAGRADVLHWYCDARANNLYLDSAFTREAMLELCKLINYQMTPASPSIVTVTINLKTGTTLPKTISKSDLIVLTSGTVQVPPLRFEAIESHIFTSLSEDVDFIQGETITDEFIGVSDGSEWQEFNLKRKNFLKNSSSITIGASTWTEVDDFLDYGSSDTVYIVFSRDDDTAFVRFGDGIYGKKPDQNYDIFITYRVGGGNLTNIQAGEITTYAGTDLDIESVTNSADASGGSDKETIEHARRTAPITLASQERAVKELDFIALSEKFPGVLRAGVIPNAYGLLSVQVQIVPTGGGYPSTVLKNNLQADLISRSPLESIDIRCTDPNYISVSVAANVKILPNYTWSWIEKYIKLSFDLILSEKTRQVLDSYLSSGVGDAIIIIQTLFGYSFLSEEYNQIEKILNNISDRNWGDNVNLSDLYAIDAYIEGVDYIIITSPTSPISIASDEITTEGTHTLTQI